MPRSSNLHRLTAKKTIFYIDLRHYEWDIKSDKWYKIEQAYPYGVQLKSSTYIELCKETNCQLPFIRADWFIATASLPPLYHDILDLPKTDRELETQLEVNVAENLKNAPGVRVWRAGFNESGVSVNNRIVERHKSRYGAYWKSYDFAGNVGTQNIFTHPLDFTHDGGEIIFNLPNGLQGYYLSTANIRHQVEKGESLYEISKEYGVSLKSIVQVNNIRPTVRLKVGESLLIPGIGGQLDAAPINIVSNTGARDPVVRNGLSCMGCHTAGMKTFEDQVRSVIEQNLNPSYDKPQALRLYAEKSRMDSLVREDIERYRQAIEAAGGVFGGSEPIQQLVKQFEGPLYATHAAAEVGLETDDFLKEIRKNRALQNAGLLVLGVENGTVKRDAWASQFGEVVSVLNLGKHTNFYADMALIPAGEFQMGSNNGEYDEQPVHSIYVDAFYMDVHEVTNVQYKKFVDTNPQWQKNRIPDKYHDGNYLKHWNGNTYPKGKGNHPVTYVSWYAAMAYAQWVGKRLPTESEWEKAARGGLPGRKYPWGNLIDSSKANYDRSIGDTAPVGQYTPNTYGLYDMSGNVWEWCLDAYHVDFYARSSLRNPVSDSNISNIISNFTNVKSSSVLRGGSWRSLAPYVRSTNRYSGPPKLTTNIIGLRCAKDVAR